MAEPYEIKMPQLSDTMTEGVVVTWEKQVGDKIKRGDIVATVETDKAVMDVEVFRDGYLSGPIAAIDSTVAVGQAIGYIVESATDAATDAAVLAAATAGKPVRNAEKPVAVDQAADLESVPVVAPVVVSAAAPAGAFYSITMPQLSDTMTEGVVVTWEKQPGDKIKRGDIVATVETDKAVMDVEVFKEGFLSGPIAPIDSTVAVGAAMAYLVEKADQVVREEAKPGASATVAKTEHAVAQAPASAVPAVAAAPVSRPAAHPPPVRKGALQHRSRANSPASRAWISTRLPAVVRRA